jgi:steroid delta-isomerase-like uncharacterized protein
MAVHSAALHAAVDAWNAHDPERYVTAYRPDAALHGFPEGVVDPPSLTEFFAGLWAAVPDARLTIEDIVEEGDRLAVRLTLTGTHEGELMGVPASQRPISISVLTILLFDEDSRIAERWNVADFLTLLQQIGGMPVAAG